MCETADLLNDFRFALPTKFTPSAVNYIIIWGSIIHLQEPQRKRQQA